MYKCLLYACNKAFVFAAYYSTLYSIQIGFVMLFFILICSRVNGYINSSFGPFKMKEKEGLLLILKLIGLIEIVNVAFFLQNVVGSHVSILILVLPDL